MKEQTRDTAVQVNEEEIGKLPEKKNKKNDSRWSETLKTKGKNVRINYQRPTRIKEQSIYRQTAQLLKLKIL